MVSSRTAGRAALASSLWALAGPVQAQPRPRHGAYFGASIGLGNSSPDLCIDCKTGLFTGLRGGGMLTPRLGLQAEFVSVSTAPNILSDVRGRHDALLAGLQYWPAERFWIKGGLGVAGVQREDPPAYDYSTSHLAGLVGVGVEINPRSRFVIDASLMEMMSGDSPARFPREAPHETTVNTVMFAVGLTWHRR
jgi:hypothetical protein